MTPTPQPKALELADYLDWGVTDRRTRQSSSAELRRQHAEITELRAEVERERESRKAAQARQEELTAEVVRLEPMRQRAADIERLTAEVERKSDAIQRLWAERDSLRVEVERLRADAERYRWLRHEDSAIDGCALIYAGDALDAAIDNAREAKG